MQESHRRESNPGLLITKQLSYHYTTAAECERGESNPQTARFELARYASSRHAHKINRRGRAASYHVLHPGEPVAHAAASFLVRYTESENRLVVLGMVRQGRAFTTGISIPTTTAIVSVLRLHLITAHWTFWHLPSRQDSNPH